MTRRGQALAAGGAGLLLVVVGAVVAARAPGPSSKGAGSTATATSATSPRPAPTPPPPPPPTRPTRPTRPEAEGPSGPPTLPADPGRSYEVILAYERDRPDDLAGRIALWEQLLTKVSGVTAEQVQERIDALVVKRDKAIGQACAAVQARVQTLVEAGDLDGALAAWAEARRALPRDVHASIDHEVARLRRMQEQVEALRRAVAALPADGEDDAAALRQLALALRAAPDARDLEAGVRARERAAALRERGRDADRRRGEARLQATRAAIAAAGAARVTGLAERERQAVEASAKRKLLVAGTARVVTRLTEEEVELADASGQSMRLRLASRPDLGAQVLELGCRPDHPEDLRDLVAFCLRHRLFERARKAAGALARADAALAASLPDLAALRRAARPFRGDPPGAGVEGGVYDFRREEGPLLLGDWEGVPRDARLTTGAAGLTVEAGPGGGARFKEVTCDDRATIEVDWPSAAGADGIVEARLDCTDAKGQRLAVHLCGGPKRAARLLAGPAAGELEPVSDWVAGGRAVKLTLGGGKAVLECGARRAEAAAPAFARVRVLLGSVPRDQAPAPRTSITWPRFTFSGLVAPQWRWRSMAAYDDLLWRELLLPPSGGLAPTPDLPSTDDAFTLAALDEAQLGAWRDAWRRLRAGDAKEVAPVFRQAVAERGGLASSWYGRALVKLAAEERWEAREDLDAAISLEPGFAEALAARAEVRVRFGDLTGAAQDVELALSRAPDLAPAWRAAGLLALERAELERAREAFGLAAALDPADALSRRRWMSVREVLAGPPWETTHVHASEHFVVSTNLTADEARVVAEKLERGRTACAGLLGAPVAAEARAEKATCLVFDAEDGFRRYASLAHFDHPDITFVGLYSRPYAQLLLFREAHDEDGERLEHVLYHEGFHRYAHEVMPHMPRWLDEGLAEVLAAELTRGGPMIEGRLRTLEGALAAGRVPSAAALLQLSSHEFYGPASDVHYASAWALCRYLLRGPAPAGAKAALAALLEALRERSPGKTASEEAFQAVDLAELDRGWRAWLPALREQR